ncbi:unnamed protein product, partial [Eretmochelys imbricata]
FTDVVTPPGNHKSINSGIAYLHKSEFDGSDLDFEYLGPRGSPPEDKHCFAILIQEMLEAFTAQAASTGCRRPLISAAVWTVRDY